MNTETLSNEIENLRIRRAHSTKEFSNVLTGLRESVYKVEEIKLVFASQSDPTERRLQELQPIDSEDTGKRNNFRASLSQIGFLIQLLKSELEPKAAVISRDFTPKKIREREERREKDILSIESIVKNNWITIKAKTLTVNDLELRVLRVSDAVNGVTINRPEKDEESKAHKTRRKYESPSDLY